MKKESIKKYVLIGTCIILVLLIFFRNVLQSDKGGGDKDSEITTDVKETISKREAFRLLNFLSDQKEETDQSKMTCGEFRDAIYSICKNLELDYSTLIKTLPKRLLEVQEEDLLYLEEFLYMYEKLINMANESGIETQVTKKHVYILGYQGMEKESTVNEKSETKEASKLHINETLITSEGKKLRLSNALDYSDVLTYLNQSGESAASVNESLIIKSYEERLMDVGDMVDRSFSLLCAKDEIIYCIERTEEQFVIHNAFVVAGEGKIITIFAEGLTRTLSSKTLSETITQSIGDITVEAGKVVGVVLKQGAINGKVLMADDNHIEIEGYGKLELDEYYRIYKIYDELEMEQTNSVLVGYANTNFIIINGKICAALITQKITAKNIRVLIKNDGFNSNYHETVVFTSDRVFKVKQGEEEIVYSPEEEVTITRKDMENGRITITTPTENGKIKLLSVNRGYGNPAYRGSMEIALMEEGLIIVNELSLEEYLYAVVPSEMPTTYGMEALKAQAVCARSYAYNYLMANKYREFGAHVDDSVNCQVYNNIKEDENSVLAVKETYGKVIEFEGNVITAFYFSTSAGHTTSIEDVWENGSSISYLVGSLQMDQKPLIDLRKESVFREYIQDKPVTIQLGDEKLKETLNTYDSGYNLYRWNVTISEKHLSSRFDEILSSRYRANQASILTKVTQAQAKELRLEYGDKLIERKVDNNIFISKSISTIGTIKEVSVIERGMGGIIKEMVVEGSKETILICFQTNVRMLFAPVNDSLYRIDGTKMDGMTMLPSAFFMIDKVKVDGETAFRLSGGGYGHGLGMSQNGAKTMASKGKTFDEILMHYYPGIQLKLLYQVE